MSQLILKNVSLRVMEIKRTYDLQTSTLYGNLNASPVVIDIIKAH